MTGTDAKPMGAAQAYSALTGYAKRYGRLPLLLLIHSAVPQSFRADLINLIKLNFMPEAGDDLSVDADLLLSSLVQPLGNGFYCLDAEVRNQCLMLLDAEYKHEPERRRISVARFMLAYLDEVGRRPSLEASTAGYVATEREVATAFVDPQGAAARFATALAERATLVEDSAASPSAGKAPGVNVHLSNIASALSLPLAAYPGLLEYARRLGALQNDNAADEWRDDSAEPIEIGGITLKPLAQIAGRRRPVERQPASQTTENSDRSLQIYISYARDDDLPPPGRPDSKGFVTFLSECIQYEFRDFGPDRPKVWRDIRRISDGGQFSSELDRSLRESSMLLVVLSPNWIASEWCNRELQIFAKYHGPDGIRERIVVVGKRHTDFAHRPALLRGQTGFEFYARSKNPDDIAGDTEFFDHGEARDERYWQKLKALVAHVLKRQPAPPVATYRPSGRTIYVAKPASDMRAGYDRIASELIGRGHTVVPAPIEEIPLDGAVEFIDKALSAAEISIHILGERAGATPEDQLPMVKLQLARASEAAGKDSTGKFHRLVWAPALWSVQAAADQPAQETVRNPVDVLTRFDRNLPSDEVQGDSLSKFVDFINQHLTAIAGTGTRHKPASGTFQVFLMHSQEDSDYAINLAAALQSRGVEVHLPVFEGPDKEIKSFNDMQLAQCDAVILCWAAASEVWVRAQASGLRNWRGLGRKQQFSYRAVVAAPPPGSRKKFAQRLFPRADIDLVVDLSDKFVPTAELLDTLVPAAHAAGQ